jgi:hypothetical protein
MPEQVEPVLARLAFDTCRIESRIKNALPHPISVIWTAISSSENEIIPLSELRV